MPLRSAFSAFISTIRSPLSIMKAIFIGATGSTDTMPASLPSSCTTKSAGARPGTNSPDASVTSMKSCPSAWPAATDGATSTTDRATTMAKRGMRDLPSPATVPGAGSIGTMAGSILRGSRPHLPAACYRPDSMSMSRFRPAIDALDAYVPGEQPAVGAGIVKLNTNENPYPPSPRALAALRTVDGETLRRYPQPFADAFRSSAAEVLGVDPEWILVGNGSDDLLTMLFRAVTAPQRAVAFPTPTYVLYRTLAAIQGAPVLEVPFDGDYTLPVDALADAGAALTLVANPNSPSGTAATVEQLAELADRTSGILVVDEAYVGVRRGLGHRARATLRPRHRSAYPFQEPRPGRAATWLRHFAPASAQRPGQGEGQLQCGRRRGRGGRRGDSRRCVHT